MRSVTTVGSKNETAFAPLFAGIGDGEGIVRLGLIEDGRPVGALAASVSEERADLLHFYISENARRRGNGSYLIEAFLQAMTDAGLKHVCICYPVDEAMDDFLEQEGFLVLPGDEMCVLDVGAMLSSPQVRKMRDQEGAMDGIKPLSTLTDGERAGMLALLDVEDLKPEDIIALNPDEELSAVVSRGGHVSALILVQKEGTQCMVQFLCTEKGANAADVQRLLIHLTRCILKDPVLEEIVFDAMEKKILAFTEKLAGDPALVQRKTMTSIAGVVLETAYADAPDAMWNREDEETDFEEESMDEDS